MADIIATCREEGGYYTPDPNPSAPIRFYSDGRVEDDFIKRGWREPLTAEDIARVREAAAENRRKGLV